MVGNPHGPSYPHGPSPAVNLASGAAAATNRPAQADEKISPAQMAALAAHLIIATVVVVVPSAIIRIAQQDSWLSAILGTALALIVTAALALVLAHAAPGRGLLEALSPLWPWPARLLAFILGVGLLHLEAVVGVQIGILWNLAQMPETPVAFFVVTAVGLAAFMARAGIEPLGRTGLIIAGLLAPAPALLLLLTLNLLHPVEFLPVLASGWQPVWAGVQPVAGFAGEIALILLLLGHLYVPPSRSPARTAVGTLALGLAISGAVAMVFLFVDVAALGPRDAGRILFPTLSTVRMIRFGEFLQRLEGAVLLPWSWGIIVKLAVVHLAACQAWGTVFGVRDPRLLSLPIAGLTIGAYRLLFSDVVQFAQYLSIWGLLWLVTGLLPIAIAVGLVWLRRPPRPRPRPRPRVAGAPAATVPGSGAKP